MFQANCNNNNNNNNNNGVDFIDTAHDQNEEYQQMKLKQQIDFSLFEFDSEDIDENKNKMHEIQLSSQQANRNKGMKPVVYLIERTRHNHKVDQFEMKKMDNCKLHPNKSKEETNNNNSILKSCKYSRIKDQGIIGDVNMREIHLRNLRNKIDNNFNDHGMSQQNDYDNDYDNSLLKKTIITRNQNNEIMINSPNQKAMANFVCFERSNIFSLNATFDLENNTNSSEIDNKIIWNAKEPLFNAQKNSFSLPLSGRYKRMSMKSKHNFVMENKRGQNTFIVRKVKKEIFEIEVSPLVPLDIVFGLEVSALVGPSIVTLK